MAGREKRYGDNATYCSATATARVILHPKMHPKTAASVQCPNLRTYDAPNKGVQTTKIYYADLKIY